MVVSAVAFVIFFVESSVNGVEVFQHVYRTENEMFSES